MPSEAPLPVAREAEETLLGRAPILPDGAFLVCLLPSGSVTPSFPDRRGSLLRDPCIRNLMQVPTANRVKSHSMNGLAGGLPAGIGSAFGSQILGRGLGTAAGGVLGAAVSNDRTMAQVAVYQGTHELLGRQAVRSSSSTRGTM